MARKREGMSKLYSTVESDARKNPVTARGHKHISSHVMGHGVGIEVSATTTDIGNPGEPRFVINITGGGSYEGFKEFLAAVIAHDDGTYTIERPISPSGL